MPVSIDGTSVNMLLDTGGFYTVLDRKTADRMHLVVRAVPYAGIRFFDGTTSNLSAKPGTMLIGNVPFRDHAIYVANFENPLFDGILGAEILSVFDVDLDFAGGKVNLFAQGHCPGKIAYWTHGATPAAIDFEMKGNHIALEAEINGKTVKAVLDSGASTTVMKLETAADILHMDADQLRRMRNEGKAQKLFETLTFQNIAISQPAIHLISKDESKLFDGGSQVPQIIIGMGVLRQLHLYIAYKEKKLYVTPAVMPPPSPPPAAHG